MKPFLSHSLPDSRLAGRGFTLVEMMVAVTVFFLLIVATVSVQIYATRIYTLAAAKLNVSAEARATMNNIRDQVRAAHFVYVGNYTNGPGSSPTNFVPITDGNPQQGNALMIYPNTSANFFTLFYLQSQTNDGFAGNAFGVAIPNGTNSLIQITYTNGTLEASNDIADFITNEVVFDAENFVGTVLTASENNYLIHMTLDFSQAAFPIAFVGTNKFNAYDYYQLNTTVARRETD